MAKVNPKLKAQIRTVMGKKVKRLRLEGIMPSTVYGKGFEPMSIQVVSKEFEAIFAHTGESGLVDLVIDDKTYPILFKNPQYHPVWGNLIHVDAYKVNLKEKITATVPLEFVGESMAVKLGNILVEVIDAVEVEALPTDLPEKIVVDISKLETLESQITIADLNVDKSIVEIKNPADQVIVKVEEPRVEEEPVVVEEAVAVDVPATAQKTPEEKAADEAKAAEEKKKEKEDK